MAQGEYWQLPVLPLRHYARGYMVAAEPLAGRATPPATLKRGKLGGCGSPVSPGLLQPQTPIAWSSRLPDGIVLAVLAEGE
jgi:hypothetical protein